MSDANIFPLGVQQIFKKSLILHVMLKSKHCKFKKIGFVVGDRPVAMHG